MATRHKGSAKKRPRKGGIQYTIRDIPADVDRALRHLAHAGQQSLNEVARAALVKEALAAGGTRRRFHDLDDLAGTWVDDAEFDLAIDAQHRVDPELWQ